MVDNICLNTLSMHESREDKIEERTIRSDGAGHDQQYYQLEECSASVEVWAPCVYHTAPKHVHLNVRRYKQNVNPVT